MSYLELCRDGLTEPVLERVATLSADLSVKFSLSEDFDELHAANEANRDNWDPLMPQFHPRFYDQRKSPAFWVRGVDSRGTVIAARGYRRFDFPDGKTLHDALLDLTLFYDDPANAGPDETIETSAAMPQRIFGSFVFTGALWVHPTARRIGLPALMKPIGRAAAFDRWDVPLLISLVEEQRMRNAGAGENSESGIRWSGSYVAPECRFKLLWWSRDEIGKDVARFVHRDSAITE